MEFPKKQKEKIIKLLNFLYIRAMNGSIASFLSSVFLLSQFVWAQRQQLYCGNMLLEHIVLRSPGRGIAHKQHWVFYFLEIGIHISHKIVVIFQPGFTREFHAFGRLLTSKISVFLPGMRNLLMWKVRKVFLNLILLVIYDEFST